MSIIDLAPPMQDCGSAGIYLLSDLHPNPLPPLVESPRVATPYQPKIVLERSG